MGGEGVKEVFAGAEGHRGRLSKVTSCKVAELGLDPPTGSRVGYGFVSSSLSDRPDGPVHLAG